MSGNVYVAEYVPTAGGDGKLVKAEVVPFTLDEGNTDSKTVNYTFTPAEGNEIKVFIWDNNLVPYTQPVSKKNN